MALVIDGVLSAAALRRASTPSEFVEGQEREAAVSQVALQPGRAHGWVTGRRAHTVVLDWSEGRLRGGCSCRESRGDPPCRHVVALGLAALASARTQVRPPTRASSTAPRREPSEPLSPVEQWLGSLGLTQLHDLVVEVAAYSADATRLLETSAALALGQTDSVQAGLVSAVEAALGAASESALVPTSDEDWGGYDDRYDDDDYVGYHESYALARDASAVLDELETHLAHGRADLTLEPLLLALTRLQTIAEHADDSSGVIGAECERAAGLYARACREGHPDGPSLAGWLARFRARSGGWPALTLTDFAPALDETSLAVYRDTVATLDGDDEHEASREVSRMLLELADHEGDVDAAVAILHRGEHPAYGAIVARLERAGRPDQAGAVMDRAVANGRVTVRAAGDGRSYLADYWLDPERVADRYLELGQPDDAIAMLRALFQREPNVTSYRILVGFAARLDTQDTERDRTLAQVRKKAMASRNGTLLVQLLLSDGDLDGAWAVADDIGPGSAWEVLAKAAADTHPARAADLYRPRLADLLSVAKTGYYPQVAEILTTMRWLYVAAGSGDAFDDEIRALRVTYKRRTSLMKELDRAKLPK